MDASSAQVKVVFTTNEEDLVLPESKQQLLVPAGENLLRNIPQTGKQICQLTFVNTSQTSSAMASLVF